MKKLFENRKLAVGIAAVLASVGIGSAVRLLTDSPNAAMDVSEPILSLL